MNKYIMITKFLTITFTLILVVKINAQQTTFKFDFGTTTAAKGYIAVTPETIFNNSIDYGFNNGSSLEAIKRSGNNVTSDFVTSTKPFYFSVKLPEGNYDVKVLLGDSKGTSATTVRVENRRLMLENRRTKKGEIATEVFTVHVKDSLIRNANGDVISKVKIKPREINYLHWDNLLTIEFNDSLPKVCGVEITPNNSATQIFLAGNSTVVDQDKEPWASWGQIVPRYIIPNKAVVCNYAESGEALISFMSAKRLEKILNLMKKGDYLFIEFGHNDQKQKGDGVGAFTTYKKSLEQYISLVKNKGGIPILVTSMHRRNFDSTGKIVNTLGEYPAAVRLVAKEQNVALIDLNDMSKTMYEAWGEKESIKAFVHYPANTFPNQKEALKDNTHFNTYGAYEIACCIISSIKKQKLPIASFIKKDFPFFDPSKPMGINKFYWPPSVFAPSIKPDGN
jgi:lysophospholipase L1-like esterase